MSCLSGMIPKPRMISTCPAGLSRRRRSERRLRRGGFGKGRGPTPGGPCINATSLDSRAKRIASLCDSLSVWSKKLTSGNVSGKGVGESRPKRMRMSGVYSLSVIFCSRCIV